MTIKEAKGYFRDALSEIYPDEEIGALQRIVFEELFEISSAELTLMNDNNIVPGKELELKRIINQLKEETPIQYIFGRTEFYDLELTVNKNVLIPRPETEELVDWIIRENNTGAGLSILDIGTGSGCIILSVAKKMLNANCFATDVSGTALSVAKRNAEKNNLEVSFSIHDILKAEENPFQYKYDIIVSNPPYVLESEKTQMQKNVLGYEPGLALFVKDDDALIYYSAIAGKAKEWLKPGGRLYFEINEQKGEDVYGLLASLGYKDVAVRKDLGSKDRMVRGVMH